MGTEKERSIEYLIPANVSAKFEFFEGFGWYEFKLVAIACLIGLLIFFGLGIFKKTIYLDQFGTVVNISNVDEYTKENLIMKRQPRISAFARSFAIIIPGAVTFLLVKKEPSSGRSTIDILRYFKEFKNKQKTYLYKYNSGSEG